MNREVSSGTIVATLLLVVLAIAGVWALTQGRERQSAREREAIIQHGIGVPPGARK